MGVDLDGREERGEWEDVEERETVIKIYCIFVCNTVTCIFNIYCIFSIYIFSIYIYILKKSFK